MKKNTHNTLYRRVLSAILVFIFIGGAMPMTAIPASAATSDWLFPLPSGTYRISQGPVSAHLSGNNNTYYAIDIVKPSAGAILGTPIYAPQSGTATRQFSTTGYGNHIILTTDDGYTIYLGHMDSITLANNGRVNKGTQLGTVGNTGTSTGPHLHFEIRPLLKTSSFTLFGRNSQSYTTNSSFEFTSGGSGDCSNGHNFVYNRPNDTHEGSLGHREIWRCTRCQLDQGMERWTTKDGCCGTTQPPVREIKVASHGSGTGQGGGLSVGHYPNPPFGPGPTIGNDEIAWISIPAGLAVVAFVHAEYKGDFIKLYGKADYDLSRVEGGRFHREISSLIVGTTSEIQAWSRPAQTYTITYNANGGQGAPGNQTKTENIALTLSGTRPTRDRYAFQGWATSSGGSVLYQPEGQYPANANANVTLYAVWKEITYSVTVYPNCLNGPYILKLSNGQTFSGRKCDDYGYVFDLPHDGYTTITVPSDHVMLSDYNTTQRVSGTAGQKTDSDGTKYFRSEAGAVVRVRFGATLYWDPKIYYVNDYNLEYWNSRASLRAVANDGSSFTMQGTLIGDSGGEGYTFDPQGKWVMFTTSPDYESVLAPEAIKKQGNVTLKNENGDRYWLGLPGSEFLTKHQFNLYFSPQRRYVTSIDLRYDQGIARLTLDNGQVINGRKIAGIEHGYTFDLPGWTQIEIPGNGFVATASVETRTVSGTTQRINNGNEYYVRAEGPSTILANWGIDIYDDRWRPADIRQFVRECLLSSGWIAIDAATEANAVTGWAQDLWWLQITEEASRQVLIQHMSTDRANFMQPAGTLTRFERIGDTLYISYSDGKSYIVQRDADGAFVHRLEQCYTYENLPTGWTLHHTASATDIFAGNYTTIHSNGAIEFITSQQDQLRYRSKGGFTAWDNNQQPTNQPDNGTQPQPDPDSPKPAKTRSVFEWILFIFCFGWIWME